MENVTIVDGAVFLLTIAYGLILFRIVLRRLKHEKYEPDDYLMLSSLVLYTINTASYPVILNNGTNLDIGIQDPTKLSPTSIEQFTLGSQWAIVERLFYLTYIWTIKACILIYYTRLPLGRNSKFGLKATAGTLALTWVICVLALLEECQPLSDAWQIIPDTPDCATAVNAISLMSITNLMSSLMLMAIPIPTIIRANLSMKGNILIGAVYFIGVFVTFGALVRMIIALDNLGERAQLIWALLECFFITVVANAPIIYGLYQHGIKHIRHRRYRSESCNVVLTGDNRDGGEASGGEKKREGRARKTWRRISRRSNAPLEIDAIQCTVEMVQSRKTGVMEELDLKTAKAGPAEKEFDIFTGDTSGKLPLAKIKSFASAKDLPKPEKTGGLLERGKEMFQPRKSAILEVD